MLKIFNAYASLNKSVRNIIAVQFLLNLINVSFINILPLYMKIEGYTESEYAHFASYRYLGVLVLAFFLGMYMKGKKILPLVYMATICVPLFALIILYLVPLHNTNLLITAHLIWGICFTFIHIPVIPFIVRNAPEQEHTQFISLSFITLSGANITASLLVSFFNGLNPELFNERTLLLSIATFSFLSTYFAFKINKNENIPLKNEKRGSIAEYNWKLIMKAVLPTAMFAIGAGFIVPFIGLFFVNVYGMTTAEFSFLCFITAVLVTFMAFLVPKIKEKYGYQKAVPLSQILAIFALLGMATTQYYSHLPIAMFIAAAFYFVRQPLMSLAVPMSMDITMKYVGDKNREMTSGLISAIWSGSAYFSSIAYGVLRSMEITYVNIFYITAGMYVFAVIFYKLLLNDYYKREKAGLIA